MSAAGQKAPPGASPITGPQLIHTVLPAAALCQGTHRKQTGWAGQGQATPPPSQHLGPDLDRSPQRAADNLAPGLGASAKGAFSSAESGTSGPSLHVSVYFMDFLH